MDYQATTPVDERVLEAMLPYFAVKFGNSASRSHSFGWEAEEGVDRARRQVAALLGAEPKEIIFTSGATESDNLAIRGVLAFHRDKGNHVVTVATEHKAVLDPLKSLERAGEARVTRLKPGRTGLVDPDDVARAITAETVLVTVMHANNEIGVIQPIGAIGCVARDAGVLFHCDAAQSVGKLPIDVEAMSIDLLSLSAHKLYGPKGSGALYVRARNPRVRLTPLVEGGGQERGMRSGTLNVPGIVGLGAACELAGAEMSEEAARTLALRERLRSLLLSELDEVTVNGHLEQRLPANLNVSFGYVEGESLLMGLKDVALSSGSACSSASLEPSHVLRAIGVGNELAHSSIRFGIGRYTTEDEVDYVADRVVKEVRRLRRLSPLYSARHRQTSAREVPERP